MKARRVTADGDEDPLASEKDAAEKKLGDALLGFWDDQLDDLEEGLGEPPKEENLEPDFWDKMADALGAVLYLYIRDMAMEAVGAAIGNPPGLGFEIEVVQETVARWAEHYAHDMSIKMIATRQRVLTESLRRYDSLEGLIDDLRPYFGDRSAELTAITEVTNAYSISQKMVYEQALQNGLEVEPIWMTLEDELVCNECGPRNGKVIGKEIDGRWPALHPDCRCFVELRWKREG